MHFSTTKYGCRTIKPGPPKKNRAKQALESHHQNGCRFSGQIRYLDEYLDDLTSIKKNLGLIQVPSFCWGEFAVSDFQRGF